LEPARTAEHRRDGIEARREPAQGRPRRMVANVAAVVARKAERGSRGA
jgi:hypothetical protein